VPPLTEIEKNNCFTIWRSDLYNTCRQYLQRKTIQGHLTDISRKITSIFPRGTADRAAGSRDDITHASTELKNVCACVWLTLSGAFSIVWSMKVYPLSDLVLAGDFLAIITFDKMEIDEFWEQSHSTRGLWHTQHFMRWVVSCTKTIFSEVVHPLNFSKNNFPLLKARPNSYLFTADLVFSLPTLFFHFKRSWFLPQSF